MKETSKCYDKREKAGDFEKYLNGSGIDIGGGPDCLKIPNGTVRLWDTEDGDAEHMSGVEDNLYDFVYSSHCLEHLNSVETGLKNWVRILKPGGYLYIVVPDYQLYEKCIWPSIFNPAHTHSFSLNIERKRVNRSTHYHINDLRSSLKKLGCTIREIDLEDDNYDYNRGMFDQTQVFGALAQITIIARKKDE